MPFQSTKYRKKELCVDNIKTIGDVYCPTCRNEKCVNLSTNKLTSFYDCKKCKACCHVLNIPFKDQKPTFILFGVDGTHCFGRMSGRDYEKLSPFLIKFLLSFTTRLALQLKVAVYWIVLESSNIYQQKVIKATVSQFIKQKCNTLI